MALTDYVIMPSADYQAACNKLREKTEKTNLIKSGDMAKEIEDISWLKLCEVDDLATSIIVGNIKTFTDDKLTSFDRDYALAGCKNLTEAIFNSLTHVDNYAFYDDSALETVVIPKALSIGEQAFYNCKALYSVNSPLVESVGEYAFYNCIELTNLELPVLRTIDRDAFYGCAGLTTFDFSNVSTISYNAFSNCTGITSVELPLVTTLDGSAFKGCINLTMVDAPLLVSIGSKAFQNCKVLTSINAPSVSVVNNYAFEGCSALKYIKLPSAITLTDYAFCLSGVEIVDLGMIAELGSSTFDSAKVLKTLILRNISQVCTINNNTFYNTPFTTSNNYDCKVYVPEALIESYKTAEYWSSMYNNGYINFVAIEDSEYEEGV